MNRSKKFQYRSAKALGVFLLLMTTTGFSSSSGVGSSVGNFFDQEIEEMEQALEAALLKPNDAIAEIDREIGHLRESQFSMTIKATVGIDVAGAAEIKVYPSLALNWVLDPEAIID